MTETTADHGDTTGKHVIVYFTGNPMPSITGNRARIRQVVGFLAAAGFRVTFYSYRNVAREEVWSADDELTFRTMFPTVSLVLESWNGGLTLARRIRNNIYAFAPALTARVARFRIPRLAPNWERLRASNPDAVYLLNYASSVAELNGIELMRTCIDTHDLIFRDHALKYGRPIWSWDIIRRMRRELSILNAAAIVLAITPAEKAVLDAFLNGREILYLPPHYRPKGDIVGDTPTTSDLLFLGSDNYKNIRGINNFLEHYCRWTWRPSLVIAGQVSGNLRRNVDLPNTVTALGWVPDLTALYRSVRAAICPVGGTGVNIKLLEALAYGKPVFATSSAIAALPPGCEGCVFPLTEESIRAVLGDKDRLRCASDAARDYVDGAAIRQLWSDFRRALIDLAEKGTARDLGGNT